MALLKRHWSFTADDSEDDVFPLSQTDNVRPRSTSVDLFANDHQVNGHLASKKSIQDRVHGLIEMDPILVAVIDTPQFQVLLNMFVFFFFHRIEKCTDVHYPPFLFSVPFFSGSGHSSNWAVVTTSTQV